MDNNIVEVLRTVMGCLTAVFIVALILGGVIGFIKGWKRSLVNLCRTLVAILLAFLTALLIFKTTRTIPMLGNMLNNALGDSFDATSIVAWMNIIMLTLVLPFIFLSLFAIYTQLLRIPAYFISKALGINNDNNKKNTDKQPEASGKAGSQPDNVSWEDPNNPPSFEAYNASLKQGDAESTAGASGNNPAENTEGAPTNESSPKSESKDNKNEKLFRILGKSGGALITATAVFIVILVSLLPISGLLYTVTDGVSGVTETAAGLDINLKVGGEEEDKTKKVDNYVLIDKNGDIQFDEINTMTNDYFSPVINNFFVKCSFSVPMRLLYNGMLGSKTVDGSVRNEISQLFKLCENSLYLLIAPEDFGDDQKAAVAGITAYVSASDLHSRMVADVMKSVSASILEDKTVLGMDASAVVNENVSELTIPLLEILKESDAESVKAFFNTVRDLLNTMIDYDVASKAVEAIETGSSDNFYELASNGDFISDMLETVYDNEDMRKLIVPAINFTFTLSVRAFDADHGPVDVADRNAVENLSDAALDNEARIIADLIKDIRSVLNTLYKITADTATTDAIAEADLTSLGRFIDKAHASVFAGEGIDEVAIAILKSSSFNSMRDVADILVKHVESGEDINWENLLLALKQFNSVLNAYKNSENQDIDELAETLREMSKSFSDQSTATIMKEIINESTILQSATLGGADDSKNSQKIMSVIIDQLASGEISDEDYENEAKALDYAMQIIKASGEESKEAQAESLKAIYGDKAGMKEMIRSMVISKMTIASINAIAYETDENGEPLLDANGKRILTPDALAISEGLSEQDKADLLEQCKEVYHEERTANPDIDAKVLEENLLAIASVFGMDITSDINEWSSHYSN